MQWRPMGPSQSFSPWSTQRRTCVGAPDSPLLTHNCSSATTGESCTVQAARAGHHSQKQSFPGESVAYVFGTLSMSYGLLYDIVACCFGLLGFPGTHPGKPMAHDYGLLCLNKGYSGLLFGATWLSRYCFGTLNDRVVGPCLGSTSQAK